MKNAKLQTGGGWQVLAAVAALLVVLCAFVALVPASDAEPATSLEGMISEDSSENATMALSTDKKTYEISSDTIVTLKSDVVLTDIQFKYATNGSGSLSFVSEEGKNYSLTIKYNTTDNNAEDSVVRNTKAIFNVPVTFKNVNVDVEMTAIKDGKIFYLEKNDSNPNGLLFLLLAKECTVDTGATLTISQGVNLARSFVNQSSLTIQNGGAVVFKEANAFTVHLTMNGGSLAIINPNGVAGNIYPDSVVDSTIAISGASEAGNIFNIYGAGTSTSTTSQDGIITGSTITSDGAIGLYESKSTIDGTDTVIKAASLDVVNSSLNNAPGIKGFKIDVDSIGFNDVNGNSASSTISVDGVTLVGDTELTAGTTLSVNSLTMADGSSLTGAGTIASGDENSKLTLGKNVEVQVDVSAIKNFDLTTDETDGPSTIVIDGKEYTIIKVDFGTVGSCTFGILVKDVPYTGSPVTTIQVNPETFNFGNEKVVATLYNSDCTIIPLEDGSIPSEPGTYYIQCIVNVEFTADKGTQNKNVIVTIPFKIAKLTPDAEVDLDGWDVKDYDADVNVPTFEYTAGNDKYTTIDELVAAGGSVSYSLWTFTADANDSTKITLVTEYKQADWGTLKTVMGTAKEMNFMLVATFGELPYYAQIEATCEVTLTNDDSSNLDVVEVFDDSKDDIYGQTEGRLEDITIGKTEKTPSTDGQTSTADYTTAIKGEVFHLDSFPAFWTAAEGKDTSGYYLAFGIKAAGTVDWTKATLEFAYPASGDETATAVPSAYFMTENGPVVVLYLGDDAKEAFAAKDIVMTYDRDGEADDYTATTYLLDLTITGTEMMWQIILVDEKNLSADAEGKLYYEKADGSKFRLPSVSNNGKCWKTAEFDGVTATFEAGTDFYVDGRFADAEGVIYLYAEYGNETPVDPTPDTPVDPTEGKVVVGGYTADGKAYFIVFADDGKAVPAGKLTVSYTYYDAALDMLRTAEIDSIDVTGTTGYIVIEIPSNAIAVFADYGEVQSNIFYA